jgi:hypothetical protein
VSPVLHQNVVLKKRIKRKLKRKAKRVISGEKR